MTAERPRSTGTAAVGLPVVLLASGSPRRSALLDQIGVSHRCLSVDVDEAPQAGEAPAAYVQRLALAKARAGWSQRKLSERVSLGADTTGVLDGELLGKPGDTAEAEALLARLSGRTHRVLTAVALVQGTREAVGLSESEVRFRAIDRAERRRYVATGEPMDKAGGYAVQGLAAIFVASLCGSYSGVMGLPLFETAALLDEFGIRMPDTGEEARDGAA